MKLISSLAFLKRCRDSKDKRTEDAHRIIIIIMIRRSGSWWLVAVVVSERGKMLAAVLALCCCARLVAATPTESPCLHGFHHVEKTDICCELCKPGQYLINECTENKGPSTCGDCPNGFYTAVANYLSGCLKCKPCEKNEEIVQPCTGRSDTLCRCKEGFHKEDEFCTRVPSNATQTPTGAPSGGGKTAAIVVAVVLLLLIIAAGAAALIHKKKRRKFPRDGARKFFTRPDGEPGNSDQPGSTASPLLMKNKQNPEAGPSKDSIEVKFIKDNRAEIVRLVCDDPGSLLDEVEALGYADVHSTAIAQTNKVGIMTSPCTLHIIGGQGGNTFSFDGQENAATLQKLSVSVGGWQVRGVEVWLTDGRRETFGTMDSSAQEFEFESGEFITSLSLWSNGDGTRLGAIKFRTSRSREFFAKMTDWGLKTEYKIDVGSGICLGVQGRAGSDIDSMGFLFINAIKSSVIQDMKYPTMHQVLPNVQMEEINKMEYKNDTSVVQSYTFESSKKINKTSSWSTTNKIESTFSLTVNAGIPKIVEAGGGFSFAEGSESTHKVEESKEETETLTFPVSVPPHKTINVVANIGHAKVDLPYTALLRITCVNGASLDAPLSGVYKGLTYTKMTTVATES
uniref:Uncharacterized protein LOC116956965 isoform X1 n=2 Tax=Petromyzon marinus TaxID=7757 RepID=A0AAJ7UED3_PETMA|nr:uncharacterized protein LOC116956965 isoform X1 [Petromyzon marinus]